MSAAIFTRFFAVAAILFSSGCVPEVPAPLRVGLNAWPGFEFLFLAQEKGMYRELGLDARLIEFSSLSDCARAFERGQIDVMGGTVMEVLQARERARRSPQIVKVVDQSIGADVILARPGIAKVQELKGAKVGVELASLGVFVLQRGLEKYGLSMSDIKVFSMDQISMEEAFRSGELDAVVTYPPSSIRLLRDQKVHAVFSTAEIPEEVVDVIAVEEGVGKSRPQDIKNLLKGFDRAVEFARQKPAEAYALMAAREGISSDEFVETLVDGIQVLYAKDQEAYFGPNGKMTSIVDHADFVLRQTGQVQGPDRRQGAVNGAFVPTEVTR